jgi:hypothetical protein
MAITTKKILITLLLAGLSVMTMAQPGGGGDPGGGQPVPISGLEILVGAGALLGARKLYQTRTSKNR